MKYLEEYCLSKNLPIPKIAPAKEGDILTKGAQARADSKTWVIFVQPWHTKPSDYMLAHELAHLIVGKDDPADSVSHGKRFVAKQLEIEKFFADKRREERRKK